VSEQRVDVELGEHVVDVRAVGAHRLEIIDATSGGRFHHAMSDQRARAQAFERLLRWQRMRQGLKEPVLLRDEVLLRADPPVTVELRAVTSTVEPPALGPVAVH
jgi:hypothetical protein